MTATARLNSIVYPNGAGTYTYTYDSLSRLATLVQDSTTTLVNGVQYGPANELLQLNGFDGGLPRRRHGSITCSAN